MAAMSADTAPAEMPGVEEIARAIYMASYDGKPNLHFEDQEAYWRRLAAAVASVFEPILAKERAWAERGWNAFRIASDQAMANGASAQAAKAALAAERERAERTIAARDRRIARLVWAMDYARSQGVAFPADNEPKVVLSDAAAIRAQGE